MASSSPARQTWSPPPLETIEAKREWVQNLRHEAALMSAQADFHLRCDLAGYHSHHHRLLARLAQGLPLTHGDGVNLVEQFKHPVAELTPRALVRLSRTLQRGGFHVESCYLYVTVGRFAAAAARLGRRADDAAYVEAARAAYEGARIDVGPPPLRPASRYDRLEFARLVPLVRAMRARALTWARELDKLEKRHSSSSSSSSSSGSA